METKTIKIEGMSCEHCVKAITKAVGALAGVESVKVSLENAAAEVKYDPAKTSLDKIKAEIDDQGYEVAG
ncbi:MAG: copper chaperone CopZ [Synergistaceae bacterium]|nr:copper chaperone CopZ [Synergistaceae bacterium]